jgi:hypothetical protein
MINMETSQEDKEAKRRLIETIVEGGGDTEAV